MDMDTPLSNSGIPEHLVKDRIARANAIVARKLRHPRPLPNVLCALCRQVVKSLILLSEPEKKPKKKNKFDKASRLRHHSDIRRLFASALDGCHLCAIFASNMYWSGPNAADITSLRYHVCVVGYEDPFPGLVLERSDLEANPFLSKIVGVHSKPCPPVPLTSWKTDSDSTFQLIRRWIDLCEQHHHRCVIPKTHDIQLPRRLIEISYGDGGLSTRLRLVETISKATPYVCLSHCWGKTSSIKLTRDNEASFHEAIELSSLPPSFLDAVVITKRLGYSYLWIDSLCITQDSTDDWADQIPIMGEIYRNSILTIAALKAENSQGGCFSTRNALGYSHCKLPHLIKTREWFLGVDVSDSTYGPTSTNTNNAPLHSRAWVVQERAMAPRTIYFGAVMVHWECVQCTASEAEPVLADAWMSSNGSLALIRSHRRLSDIRVDRRGEGPWDPTLGGLKNNLAQILEICGRGHYKSWEAYWWRIIETYTSCQLTYSSDRGPAIAGLAAVIQRRSGKMMCHGLWRDHMFDELLWSRHLWIRHGSGNSAWRRLDGVPSWSWLSLDCPILKWGKIVPNQERTATVHADSEALNSPSGRQLTITAPMMKIESIPEGGGGYYVVRKGTRWLNLRWESDIQSRKRVDAWTLQFLTTTSSPQWRSRTYRGLVVVPVGEAKTKWSRVGDYNFKLYRIEAWLYGEHLGQMTTINLA